MCIRDKFIIKKNSYMERFVIRDLSAQPYGISRKEWVQVALAAAGVAGSLFGGIKSGSAARKALREQKARENKENAWYQRRYNENYADTAAGRALINEAKEYARENWKKADGAAAVTGGTDAAVAQAKEAGNKMVADTVRNLATQDTARKDAADDMHMKMQDNYSKERIALEQQRADNIANTAANMSNDMMSAAAAMDGKVSKASKSDLTGKSNGGKKVKSNSDWLKKNKDNLLA